jgi:preprotein translocase subunit YajC
MGARQSKRSVDITTTPKKGDDVVVEGEGKVEKIAEIDAKVTTNGAIHTEIEYAVRFSCFCHASRRIR